ncbi:MAG: hypothetical protein O2877_02395 [bacterium]|nr:hypothetical protein [bacterium]
MENKYEHMSEDFEFEPEHGVEDESLTAGILDSQRSELAIRILRQTKDSIQNAIDLLDSGDVQNGQKALVQLLSKNSEQRGDFDRLQADRVVEGVFDGEQMIGADGQSYIVPANYASKSRLVEGDIMKLTVRKDGVFIYKQIGPIERRRITARLAWDASSESYVALDDQNDMVWKVLNSSVSFFKGQEGDTVVILIPKSAPSVWGAVENVVRT